MGVSRSVVVGGFSEASGSALAARAYFLLLRQKKVAKEKATLGQRPATPGPLRYSVLAGAAELGATPLRQSSPFIRQPLRCSAPTKGPDKPSWLKGCRGEFDFCLFFAVDRNRSFFRELLEPRRLWAPLRGAEQRRRAGGSRLALSEPQASSGKPPGPPSSARNPEGAPTQGSPFLCLLSFGEAKESETPARRNPKPIQPAQRRTKTNKC